MQANNTPVGTPEALSSQPQKVGAIKGLSTKIVAALAALGIATSAEKVEAATVVLGTGLSHSSVTSTPTKISGLADSATITNSSVYNSILWDSDPVANDVSIDRITVTLSAADIGSGGTLTLTGRMLASTSSDTTIASVGKGFTVGEQFRVQQEARFGIAGGSMSTIAAFDSGLRTNGGSNQSFTGENWNHNTQITPFSMYINQPGTYYLDNVLIRQNSTGTAQMQGFTLNFTAVPEPSTSLMAGGVLAAGLLRRRREKDTQAKSE